MEGCYRYIRFMTASIVVAVCLLAFVSGADASATLELMMVRFNNANGKQEDGSDCDFLLGDKPCDHVFRFVLDRGDSSNNPTGDYYNRVTGKFQDKNVIEFGENMAGVSNPIVTNFHVWPSIGVKFKVVVKDSDSATRDDDVDKLVQLLKPTPALNVSMANWTSSIMHGTRNKPTSLTIKYKLYCDANYYSSDCSVYCVANDTDAGGHYTCDPITGNIICRQGWEDESTNCVTLSNDCLNHTCVNGATCIDGVRSYTCLCLSGYTGINCETDVNDCASSPCKHGGSCDDHVNGFTCHCLPGFTGDMCETDINECASGPCKHGGTCDDHVNGFTCHCLPGFTGKLCSDFDQGTSSTSSPNQNGGITTAQSDNEKTSPPTWLYIVIAVVCVVLLGVVVLTAFICIRRRKATKASEDEPMTTFTTASSSQPTPLSATAQAAAATSFDVIKDGVDNKMYFLPQPTQENNNSGDVYKAYESMDGSSNVYETIKDESSVYETIQDEPTEPLSVSDIQSGNKLNHNPEKLTASNSSSKDVNGAYELMDKVPTTPHSSSASPPSSQPYTPLLPSSPSASAAAAPEVSAYIDADNVYIQPSNSNQLEPNSKPSDRVYANCLQDESVA